MGHQGDQRRKRQKQHRRSLSSQPTSREAARGDAPAAVSVGSRALVPQSSDSRGGGGAPEGSESSDSGTVAGSKARRWHERSALRWVAVMAGAVVVGALAGPLISPTMPETWARLSAAAMGGAGVASFSVLRRLRPLLGSLTAVAALALMWGGLLGVVAQLSSNCPGVDGAGRCGVEGTAVYVMLGMLWVGLIAAAAMPPVAVARGLARLVAAIRRRIRS